MKETASEAIDDSKETAGEVAEEVKDTAESVEEEVKDLLKSGQAKFQQVDPEDTNSGVKKGKAPSMIMKRR